MDKSRKIIVSILALLTLSAVLAIVDITLTMKKKARSPYGITAPKFGPGVGVVRLSGAIEFSSDSVSPLVKSGSTESVLRRLEELEKDSNIKAIVLRINSPGGTVAATQEIYGKLQALRKKNIILVASMGDVAASGGYYAASACNHIMANHGTITGSIGVIAVSPNLKELFEKLGIRMNVIKSGKYKDLLSSFREISPEERALVQEMIDSSYNKFLKDVSLGRNIPISDIQPYADGRVMNGETALKYKLIDEIGTFEMALARAREKAKLPEDAPVYDDVKNPLDQFFMTLDGMAQKGGGLERRVGLRDYYMLEYRYQP